MRNVILAIILFFLMMSNNSFAQNPPMKYGKIDIENLKMTTYDLDTSATALVLFDYGEFDPNEFNFLRHCRIKILREKGVDLANVYVNSRNNIMLKGETFNLVDGEIEKTKMKRESVFEDRVENMKVGTRFTLPNVKVGSIIEFEYTISGMPYKWKFQREIPVKWSELIVYQPDDVVIQKNFFGYEPLSIVENYHWVAKDMPAFRPEPFMNSSTNYLTQFEFEFREIRIPGRYYEELTTSWEQVSETLAKSNSYDEKLKGNLFLNSEADQISSLDIDKLGKAKMAYEFVKDRMVWNDRKRNSAYKDLRFSYNEKVGDVAEINLILISLLQKIGLDVKPVVLSTRDNGLISPLFPTMNKLNYVIASVEIEDNIYLLDATDKLIPFGMLPKRCINGEGRTVEKENSKWVKLDAPKNSKEVIFSELTMSNQGEIKGSISHKYYDYAAYDLRKEIEKYPSIDDYVKKKESEHVGMVIEEYSFNDIDSIYKPVSVNSFVNFQNDADIISDKIYFNPMIFEKVADNPFKKEKRDYPVDFIHPIEKTYVLNLNIPEGYVVDKLPESEKVSLPGKKGSFFYSVRSSESKIQYTYKYVINDPIILPGEYDYLKQFYELLVKKHAEMIVLKKVAI